MAKLSEEFVYRQAVASTSVYALVDLPRLSRLMEARRFDEKPLPVIQGGIRDELRENVPDHVFSESWLEYFTRARAD
jgi:hypothetical protein